MVIHMTEEPSEEPRIGLALSGGGSRAIAFHLGCLRALEEIGVMDKVAVLSTVSGGSVIGAIYASHRGAFPAFEEKIRALLSQGLVRPSVRKACTTMEGIKAMACWVLLLLVNSGALALSWLIRLVGFVLPARIPRSWNLHGLKAPIRRFASRTTILRRVFNEDVFGGVRLCDLPTSGPLLIVNAADLRTGSAFYFSSKESGSWRLGRLASSDVTLAHAVTASAAFPLLLPAVDEYLPFNKRDGSHRVERVNLTDGGVYDNLGLAPLWPDRDPSISLNVSGVDAIICCRAGYGLRFDPPTQTFLGRLQSAFACVHDRAQNSGMKRLFDLHDAGKLRHVLLPYLGQDDGRLRFPPDDLVARADALDYPTDFAAMPGEWIEKLSRRGEQLTRALIAEHWPDLLGRDV